MSGSIQNSPTTLYNAVPPVRAEGTGGTQPSDAVGNSFMTMGTALEGEDSTNHLMATMDKPVVSATYSWTRYQNLGAAATVCIKASAGQVYSAYMHNVSGAPRFFQLHNLAVAATTTVSIPAITLLVPAGGVLFLDAAWLGKDGNYFSTGVTFACSTTENVYTASGVVTDGVVQIMYI